MLAAKASIAASLCGVLRAFFGDFFSLLSGMRTSVPLGILIDLADMIDLLCSMGARRTQRLRPCPSARPGVARAGATRVEGFRPPDEGRFVRSGSAQARSNSSKVGK
ncbi:hypothetical protein [Bradyrhizobium elkanii]